MSGGNNDVSRYGEIVERSLIHEGLKHYFLVEFPQEPGALRGFLDEVLSEDEDITLFEYVKKNNRETGPALVGIEMRPRSDLEPLLARMGAQPPAHRARAPGLAALHLPRVLTAVTCFVSYAWDTVDDNRWVEQLATDLQNAGIRVVYDQWDNPRIGAQVPRFLSREIPGTDFVIVVGTPRYTAKYENRVSDTGSMVAAEMDLISDRLVGTERDKETVLPVLLRGTEQTSLPPLLRRRVVADFRETGNHFLALLDLVLTMYGISAREVRDLRESVRDQDVSALT